MPRHYNRQLTDPATEVPTGVAGITDSAATIGTHAATKSDLAFDTAVPTTRAVFPTSTTTANPGASSESPLPSPSPSATMRVIPLGTVLAVCLGTFAAVAILLFLAFRIYRRYTKPRSRQPLSPRTRGDRKSWHKLGDDSRQRDRREPGSSPQTKERGRFGAMGVARSTTESFYCAEKSPQCDAPMVHAPMAVQPKQRPLRPDPPQELEVDAGASIPWDGPSPGTGSFLPYNSPGLRSSGALTPSAVRAIPTPQITSNSEPHRWESALIVRLDDGKNAAPPARKDPFADPVGRGRTSSFSNPFFQAHTVRTDKGKGRARSQSQNRVRSRAASVSASSVGRTSEDRANPFADSDTAPQLPAMHFQEPPHDPSAKPPDHVMQSLLAALEPPPDPSPGFSVSSASSTVDGEFLALYTSASRTTSMVSSAPETASMSSFPRGQ